LRTVGFIKSVIRRLMALATPELALPVRAPPTPAPPPLTAPPPAPPLPLPLPLPAIAPPSPTLSAHVYFAPSPPRRWYRRWPCTSPRGFKGQRRMPGAAMPGSHFVTSSRGTAAVGALAG